VQAAIGNLKKVSLELGGKSPNVVLKDAVPELAIKGVAHAIFFNHGQCCCAGSRLYIEDKVFDTIVAGVAEEAKRMKLGPGMDATTEMGPLVTAEQFSRVSGYLDIGAAEGAKALCGGKMYGERGYFLEPTVLVDVKQDMQVVQEEIFGPVLVAMPFKDLEDVLPKANETMYGLGGGIWTNHLSKAHRIAATHWHRLVQLLRCL
jgi:phenylacetaldehyde dehydrogenase